MPDFVVHVALDESLMPGGPVWVKFRYFTSNMVI